ncbi:putative ATP-dependent RNA helicase DHR1-like, partial [Trifolium medium]|nr:putative ATP-dependent RNA helicase DHR1-like [Trifolium medium]
GYGSSKFHGRSGVIGVTQPRRVAVLATAKRVAYELGVRLGKEVVIFYLDMFPICSFYGVLISRKNL